MDKVTETRMLFAHVATLGLTLFGVYEFAPFFLEEGALPRWEGSAMHAGQMLNKIPWVKVAAALSLIPYAVIVSRRIPRRAVHAHREGFAEGTNWEDVLWETGSTSAR